MYTISRSIAIISPKHPFVEWANQFHDAEFKVSVDELQNDCLVILIPEYGTEEEAKEYIHELCEDIFEEELFGWRTNEPWWPKNRTQEMFWQWFEVKLHSEVKDPYEDPIEKEVL
jgi:hypothetical protein